MKKSILFIFVFSFLSSNIFAQDKNIHKKGFYIYKNDRKEIRNCIVKRTKHKQKEYYIGKEKEEFMLLKIKWLSENEYQLKLIKAKGNYSKGCFKKGDVFYTKITSQNKYEYTCTWEGSCGKGTITMIKIQDPDAILEKKYDSDKNIKT